MGVKNGPGAVAQGVELHASACAAQRSRVSSATILAPPPARAALSALRFIWDQTVCPPAARRLDRGVGQPAARPRARGVETAGDVARVSFRPVSHTKNSG